MVGRRPALEEESAGFGLMAAVEPMAALIDFVRAHSDSSANLKQLLPYLQSQEEVIIQHMPQLDDAAQALSPSEHTLGMVFVL